jgi:NAD(P)-dependent dehydrogenase (short-subunit alcohol dehydrogenase family)
MTPPDKPPRVQKSAVKKFMGKVAVVTGGAQGIGKAIAQRLSADGATVVLLDTNAEIGATAASELDQCGGAAIFLQCDVADRLQVQRALETAQRTVGAPTLLVNNAGTGARASFLELSDETWNRVIATNLTGAFIVAQETCRRMADGGGGSVVNIASISSFIANVDLTAYSVSKAGLVGLTRMMATELAPHGIRVNAVAPGPVATEFAERMLPPPAQAERRERIPLARFGTPAEVAAVVAFLLSEEASYITGAVVPIEGGLLIAGMRS